MTADHRPAPPPTERRFVTRRSVEDSSKHDGVLRHGDAHRLARAAEDLDTDLIVRMVRESVDDIGMISTWERLVQPVWQYLGSRPGGLGEGSAAEHMYVQSAMSALSAGRRSPRPAPPSVLLACADEELHAIPLEALVVALEESGATCCVLGARVPPDALAAAAAGLKPTVVVIWSQTPDTASPAQITKALGTVPAATVVAAGPGWSSMTLPGPAVRSIELSTTLVLTLAALEGSTPPGHHRAQAKR